jgi:hypothetical protein
MGGIFARRVLGGEIQGVGGETWLPVRMDTGGGSDGYKRRMKDAETRIFFHDPVLVVG